MKNECVHKREQLAMGNEMRRANVRTVNWEKRRNTENICKVSKLNMSLKTFILMSSLYHTLKVL